MDQGDIFTIQGTSKIASHPPEARRESRNRFALIIPEGTNPTDTLILDSQPPEINKCLLFKSPSTWYSFYSSTSQ